MSHTTPTTPPSRQPALLLMTMVVMALLAACQTPTPYAPAPDHGFGYIDQQLEAGRFRVVFRGNESTERATVEDFVLYRAAEVTLQEGCDYFVIVDGGTEAISTYVGTGTTFAQGGFGRSGFFYGSGFAAQTSSTIREQRRYEAGAVIQVYPGTKPDHPDAYDARSVLSSLGDKVAARLKQ